MLTALRWRGVAPHEEGARSRERGTATAELAVVLPAVVALAAMGVWGVVAVAAYVRCVDAAGAGARAMARGEPPAEVARVVEDMAPHGARVVTDREGGLVVVEVRARVPLPGPWRGTGPGIDVGDRAVALAEDPTGARPVAGDAPGLP